MNQTLFFLTAELSTLIRVIRRLLKTHPHLATRLVLEELEKSELVLKRIVY